MWVQSVFRHFNFCFSFCVTSTIVVEIVSNGENLWIRKCFTLELCELNTEIKLEKSSFSPFSLYYHLVLIKHTFPYWRLLMKTFLRRWKHRFEIISLNWTKITFNSCQVRMHFFSLIRFAPIRWQEHIRNRSKWSALKKNELETQNSLSLTAQFRWWIRNEWNRMRNGRKYMFSLCHLTLATPVRFPIS